MNFIHKDQDPKTTIKKYQRIRDTFIVEYMDGSKGTYTISNPDKEMERLNNEMLKQIALRKAKCSVPELGMYKMMLGEMLMLAATGAAISNEDQMLVAAFTIASVVFGKAAVTEYKNRKELSKYDMLLEMYNDLDKINTREYLDKIEFDPFYQVPLNLNTIDDYSYSDVRTLYKHYKGKK